MEIIQYCIPALIVLLATWIVMHKLFKNETEKRTWELKLKTQKEISSIRLRAYERLTLLLERTTPEHLLSEMPVAEMTVEQIQKRMIQTVKMEFDHNMSQQIYVSNDLWNKIILARDEVANFISAVTPQVAPDTPSLEYAKALIHAYKSNGTTPHQIALISLKDEVQALL